jgi:hypothetical protein
MSESDYSKLKAKMVKVRDFNKVKGWKNSEDWCRETRRSAETLLKRTEENSKKLKTLSSNSKKFYADFASIAKIIAGQQSDLAKAKKAKDKNKIVELEKKITILDKEARKFGDKFDTDTSGSTALLKEIELIHAALEKV